MKIGIAGLGGIGSNVARILAQAGVKKIKLVDFDRVEATNLNRQFYTRSQIGDKKTDSLKNNLNAIFPEMQIETIDQKIAPQDSNSLFLDCRIVVEGFDSKHLKKMIVEKLSSFDKILVSACGIAGQKMDHVRIQKIGQCHIVGDFTSDQENFDLFPPKIALVSAMMAGIVLMHIKETADE